jgi:hypothetical protein
MATFGAGIAAETIEVGPPSGVGDDANVELERARQAQRLCVASRQTKPLASSGSYVIALSQTDTLEQARWVRALRRRA